MPQQPLSELRVVEIGSGDALGYCGKLFADFGADVIKVEPSGGDRARNIAPLVDHENASQVAQPPPPIRCP
jgi:crotonobetainyl-CoA:carnitine CoA-transferase CaiB-like acyl-CoA transferase